MPDQERMTARAKAQTTIPFLADTEVFVFMFCNLPALLARGNIYFAKG